MLGLGVSRFTPQRAAMVPLLTGTVTFLCVRFPDAVNTFGPVRKSKLALVSDIMGLVTQLLLPRAVRDCTCLTSAISPGPEGAPGVFVEFLELEFPVKVGRCACASSISVPHPRSPTWLLILSRPSRKTCPWSWQSCPGHRARF